MAEKSLDFVDLQSFEKGQGLPAGAPIRFCAASARQRFKDSMAFNHMAASHVE
jgi:hypothetical protein